LMKRRFFWNQNFSIHVMYLMLPIL